MRGKNHYTKKKEKEPKQLVTTYLEYLETVYILFKSNRLLVHLMEKIIPLKSIHYP